MVKFVRLLFREKEKLKLRLGVASSARKEGILTNLRRLALEALFDLVVSGQDDLKAYTDPEGVNKPKPYIYLHAAATLGLSPSQCIAIEDSYAGVTAAKKAGYFTIAAPNHFTRTQDLSHADLIIHSFINLTPSDLLRKVVPLLETKL